MAKSTEKQSDDREALKSALKTERDTDLRLALADLHPADIADVLESIPLDQREKVFAQIDNALIGEVLVEVSEGVRLNLLENLDSQSLIAAAKTLDTDDVADLIPDLPDEVIAEMLFAMDKQDRLRLDSVLSYPEDTAGGLMNVDTITVRNNITLEVVHRYLRRRGELPENTNKLFVVDRDDSLLGTILIGDLLVNDPESRVSERMDAEPVSFEAMTSAREVAAAFERYNLVSAPVVDDKGKLIGRITVDDVVDVILEEAEHSVLAPAGLKEDEDLFAPVRSSIRSRAVWLGVNLVTAVIASWVIGLFEDTLRSVIALAVLMPIVASMGGNAGTQTLTVVIRGLALGVITDSNARRVLIKELLISVMNSMIWAVAVAIIAIIWYRMPGLGLVIALAMSVNLLVAALAGVSIPIVVRKIGIDPALASGVMLTTITDVVGFFVFLGLASLILI
ncbi:MAG TPA: magnesium transporter [Acidiferrobacteraceae bacterium]|nr:MAG: magnesium transporter [Gammaproteobacteria bacterium]HDO78354.1 magnesium transporter [Acidiferrobacteraceae bacterium]HEX19351.1 magnesium transporter [Acidiferrobacteraceae bacterium]